MAVIQNQYGLAKLRVITINILDNVNIIKTYARGNSALFLRDASSSSYSAYYMNGYIPLNYVIRPDSKVYHGVEGFNEATIKSWIDSCVIDSSEDCDTVKIMTVTNNGDTDLTVTDITKSDSWIVSVSPTSFTLAPDSSQNVTVTVTRDGLANGTYFGSLDISSNDTVHTPYVESVKLVVQETAPDIAVTEDILKFTWGESGEKNNIGSKELSGESRITNAVPIVNKRKPVTYSENIKKLVTISSSLHPIKYSPEYQNNKELSFNLFQVEDTLHYDGNQSSSLGLYDPGVDTFGTIYTGTRFTPASTKFLTAVSFFFFTGTSLSGTLYIYGNGNSTSFGTELMNQSFTVSGDSTWNRIDLTSPVQCIAGIDFWVVIKSKAALGIDAGPIVADRGGFVSVDEGSSWEQLSDYSINKNWNIRAILTQGESENYDTVKTMTVKNDGNINLNVTNITKSDSWITYVSPTSFIIAPGDSQSVTVVVTRDGLAYGTHYGSLNIVSDDPDENPYVETIKFVIIQTSAEDTSIISNDFKVSYPVNPMIKNASILYSVPCKMDVSIKLYDMSGRLVKTLENRMLGKGVYSKTINTELIGAGVYFCRLQAGNFNETQKLVLMK